MKHYKNLLIFIFLILLRCGADDSTQETTQITVSSISPSRVKIGDTIKLIGTNLDKLNTISFSHEDKEYNANKINVSSLSFITQNEKEITLKVPEVYHEKILLQCNSKEFKLEIVGMIPVINEFEHIRQIQVINENTAFLRDNGKIYKSIDGFYKWETVYESPNGYGVSCFYFLDEKNCWIGEQGISTATEGVSVYYSENGGVDFNFKFQVNRYSSGNQINNIKFTSLNKGFFVDNKQIMYVTDNNSFENIYDYYPNLKLLPFGQIDIWDFSAINDNLIFLAPNDTPYLIKIDEQNISYSKFDIWPLTPILFENIGYVQVNDYIYKTLDSGNSWTKLVTFDHDYTGIFFWNSQEGFAFAPSSAEMYLTNDGGTTWKKYFTFPQYHNAHHKDFTTTNGLIGSANGRLWKYRKE